MRIMGKLLSFSTLIILCNILVAIVCSKVNYLTTGVVAFLLVESVMVIIMYCYKNLIRPLTSLHTALSVIDFSKDVIDFSKVDTLEKTGFPEMQEIIDKFKYLLGIITERINRVNDARYQSEHDELSGCYNRMHLERVKTQYETEESFAIIFIDVNNLKRMNDVFGHDAGDALIKAAARKLQFWNTYGDVYRMGGDEFMIVVCNVSQQTLKEYIDNWYPTVGVLNRDGDGFKCVLSYGVSYAKKGKDFDTQQKLADDRMYDMKVAIKKKFGEPMR